MNRVQDPQQERKRGATPLPKSESQGESGAKGKGSQQSVAVCDVCREDLDRKGAPSACPGLSIASVHMSGHVAGHE